MAVGNRQHISQAVKEQLVTMSAYMTPREIQGVTDISKRTVNRVISLATRTGSVVKRSLRVGRLRILNALDIAYLEGCIERTPDIFLSELRDELQRARDVHVSEQTIRHTLLRRGFTRKWVCTTNLGSSLLLTL
ncbi:hypothetical protein BD779DRAFT_1440056 [Infundibulicybe gibba]|nr:hypothetical protein BD779DRAFT_1440056 [Infundibulicybe gibba]